MAKFSIDDEGNLLAEDLVPGSWDDVMAKWYFVRDNYKTINNLAGKSTCAFCAKYIRFNTCKQCPIYIATGHQYCVDTPNYTIEKMGMLSKGVLDLINDEIAFLEDVRAMDQNHEEEKEG